MEAKEASENPTDVQNSGKISDLYPVKNIIQLVGNHKNEPNKLAARYKSNGSWKELTWGEITERVAALAEGFVEIGVKRGDRVAIFADTCLEWILADMALLFAGAACVPVYGSDTPAELEYIIKDSGAKVIVVDGDAVDHHKQPGRYSRIRSVLPNLSTVEKIIAFSLPGDDASKLMSLADLEALGRKALADGRTPVGQTMTDAIQWDDMATLLYTSGTTGYPKGVILTHGNWVSQAYNVMRAGILVPGDNLLVFLPFAHSFGLECASVWMGQDIVFSFAESIDKLLENARDVHPTVLPAVPRIFEKAFSRVVSQGRASDGVQGKAFDWAMDLFDKYANARAEGKAFHSIRWPVAKKLVFSKIAQKLSDLFGGKIRCFVSGGAPLAYRVAYFFDVCGLVICEGFGMTETSASTHCNLDGRDGRMENRIGTCGPALPGVEVRIAEDGEVLMRGPQIMKGYYNLPKETADTLSPDGWLSTGDIGEVDEKGCLKITDRKKDLIKTSGGKYVAPAEIENELKTTPIVSQVSIQGDRRKFVSAIFTLDKGEVMKVAEAAKIADKPYSEIVKDPAITEVVQKAVDAVNARQPSYATIKKFILLDHDWSQETGEMTPTLKVKRRVVGEKYKAQLDSLYLD